MIKDHYRVLSSQQSFQNNRKAYLNKFEFVLAQVIDEVDHGARGQVSQIYLNKNIIKVMHLNVSKRSLFYVFLRSNSHIIPVYLHMCWRLRICFNLDTGFKSWTRIGPRSGRRWRKNKYRPERECSTAFSIKSTIVLLLNLVRLPKLKLPEITKRCSFQMHLNSNRDLMFVH